MPVRIVPQAIPANPTRWCHDKQDTIGLLKQTSERLRGQTFELFGSSLDDVDPDLNIRADQNGFVNSVMAAYGSHHHLIIRPDDIWIAALSQFSFYVNANAEELRPQLVDFPEKRKLVVDYSVGNRYTLDYGHMAGTFARLIQANTIDPELYEWMMPTFSTSTQHDRVIASMMMMGTMQKFFDYEMMCICGIPSVTLLGEREDYEKLASKAARFAKYGTEATQFASLLAPVIRRMVQSFNDPTGAATTNFWRKIANSNGGGACMPGLISGWITAFCFWNEDGRCMYTVNESATYDEQGGKGSAGLGGLGGRSGGGNIFLELDGVRYHHIGDGSVPPAWCALPLKLTEGGGEVIEAEILAGSTGISLTSNVGAGGLLDTVQPMSAWWVYEKKEWKDPKKDPEHIWNLVPASHRNDRWMEMNGFRRKPLESGASESSLKLTAADWEYVRRD